MNIALNIAVTLTTERTGDAMGELHRTFVNILVSMWDSGSPVGGQKV